MQGRRRREAHPVSSGHLTAPGPRGYAVRMHPAKPSRTALGAAGHRAAHQVLEGGRVFTDPLALRILGSEAEQAVRDARRDPSRRPLRLFIAVRSRFAEDAFAAALEKTGT